MSKGVAAGGTAVEDRSFPVIPVVGVIVVIGALVTFFALRGGKTPEVPAVAPTTIVTPTAPTPVTPVAPPAPVESIKSTGPSPDSVAQSLKSALSKQRLWSDVEVVGSKLEIRSGTCEEAAMGATVTSASPQLKASGLKKVRCLDKSGRPVFERDL